MAVSHLVGTAVHVDRRYLRQLCQWCGYRLIDVDLQNTATESSNNDTSYPEWPVDKWVRVDGPMCSVIENDDNKMPIDSCMRDVSPRMRVVKNDG